MTRSLASHLPIGFTLTALISVSLAGSGCGSSSGSPTGSGGASASGGAGGSGGAADATPACQAAVGAGGGVLSGTFDGTPVTFSDVNSYYETAGVNAGNAILRITVTGRVSEPECRNIALRIQYYAQTTSTNSSCVGFGMETDFGVSLSVEYVSDAGYFRTSNVPESCSGSFTVPDSGYGPLAGSFTATLVQPGPVTSRPTTLALTMGAIDLTVPFR